MNWPSTANFLATYIIIIVSILRGVFTDVLLQSSDLARALSNDLGVDVPDDINFAINPEQVVDRVIRRRLGLLPCRSPFL